MVYAKFGISQANPIGTSTFSFPIVVEGQQINFENIVYQINISEQTTNAKYNVALARIEQLRL
ncbi:MAG: hypothetical protein ACQEQD_10745 [Bacillota bacterium]